VTSPVDSDEEADIVTQAVVASQAVVAVPTGSQSPSIRLDRADRVPNEAERRRLVGQFSDFLDGVAVSGVTQIQLAQMESRKWKKRAQEAEEKVEQLEADKSALERKLMLEQVSTQTAASQGAQHKDDWEMAVARAEKAEKELAEIKAKILVPTPKTAAKLAQDRNVATMNAHLVVSLKEQLGEVAAERHLLERQLEEARASLAQQASRPDPGVGTGFRLVSVTALRQAANYAVALVKRCGMHAAMSAVTTEEIGRHMFIRHMEREFAKSLDCNCVSRAYRHIESKGVNMQLTLIPEVKQAMYLQKHYGTFRNPEVAAPVEPNQAAEKTYIEKGMQDCRYRRVKQAAIMAQGAHKAELKVQAKFCEIHPSLVVEDHDLPSTSTGPGAPVDDDEEMGEPLD
jgi:hypothetical protein